MINENLSNKSLSIVFGGTYYWNLKHFRTTTHKSTQIFIYGMYAKILLDSVELEYSTIPVQKR